MDDKSIVDLYWSRDEQAIEATDEKYGKHLGNIAYGIVRDLEDSKECVNDTYHDAWNCMPPHRPLALATFLGKITRRISIDRLRRSGAEKRGGGQLNLVLDELSQCLASQTNVEGELICRELTGKINSFLGSLSPTHRKIFLWRYWYMLPVFEIANRSGFSESKVTAVLHRTRLKLRTLLEKEGY